MSAKNKKKKNTKTGKLRRGAMWLLCVALAAVLAVLAIFIVYMEKYDEERNPSATNDQTQNGEPNSTASQAQTTAPTMQIQVPENVTIPLGYDLKIGDVGSYTGVFFEDGSDEVVSNVMMILVTNESERTLQYGEITVTNDQGEQAQFTLSTLPAGASAVVLEKNRLPYEKGYAHATTNNVVFFPEEPTLHEDKLKIQAYEGALNITNISGEDIEGDIQIFYKNSATDVFYGGITYMVRIQGGLKAGELRQLVPSHFNASGSAVMFVIIP